MSWRLLVCFQNECSGPDRNAMDACAPSTFRGVAVRTALWTCFLAAVLHQPAPAEEDPASEGQKQRAADTEKPKTRGHWGEDAVGFRWEEADSRDGRWNDMEIGPCLASVVALPEGTVAKGLTLRLGTVAEGAVCYDTRDLTLRAFWTGGFLRFDPARFGVISAPVPQGELQLAWPQQPSWGNADVQFRGHYLHGERVLLEAQVNGATVLEMPSVEPTGDLHLLTRRWEVEPRGQALLLNVLQASAEVQFEQYFRHRLAIVIQGDEVVAVAVAASHDSARLSHRAGQGVELTFPSSTRSCRAEATYFRGSHSQLESFRASLRLRPPLTSLQRWTRPGPRLWSQTLSTQGELGQSTDGPYVVDTIGIPFENPYRALMFLGGHDFFSNGDAAVCTLHGDVWRVTGLDTELQDVRWQRYATGLHQPLGLRIVQDRVYVLGRDQITRLDDRDRNGEADFYECFNNAGQTSTGGHDYAGCLETDRAGNFYYLRARTGLQRVSPEGKQHETVATGWRNPISLSVGPNDEITVAPQEGEWTPASALFMVREGGYYGYGGPRVAPLRPLGYDPPLCWVPRLVDNSTGGQVWATGTDWGPLSGHLLNLSFGRCWAQLVLHEQVEGVAQGGVVPLPWRFDSGVMRGRTHPGDGQLYVSGLKGWVSSAAQDGCFHRVRYTGGQIPWPVGLEVKANGVLIRFGQSLDRQVAGNPSNYGVEQWNYLYSATYGSDEYRVTQPSQRGREEVFVESITLLESDRAVFLELSDVRPVMQMGIDYQIRAADGTSLENTIYHTIHVVPTERIEPRPASDAAVATGRLAPEVRSALQSGLVMELLQDGQQDMRIATQAALYVPAGEFASPFLNRGSFRCRAQGYLQCKRSGEYLFSWEGTGALALWINGERLPMAEANTWPAVQLHRGYNRLRMEYESPPTGSSQFFLRWKGAAFQTEPVPATLLWHEPPTNEIQRSAQLRRGRQLYTDLSCAKCHTLPAIDRPAELDSEQSAEEMVWELQRTNPELANVGSRCNAEWIYGWILAPVIHRDQATMPQLLNAALPEDRATAADITAYLVEIATKDGATTTIPGASQEDINRGERLYEDLGCISCHTFAPPEEHDESQQRISLYLADFKFRPGALAEFLRRPQQHYAWSRMPDFRLSDDEVRALAALIRREAKGTVEQLLPGAAPNWATADAERGRHRFVELGCGQCHTTSDAPTLPPREVSPFGKTTVGGCLAADDSTLLRVPKYKLTTSDREALRSFVGTTGRSLFRRCSTELAERTIRRLDCLACHDRGHVLARWPELILEEGVQGLPPERLPPLTGVGEKLYSTSIEQLLLGLQPQPTRPWMKGRMPAFPQLAEPLARGLAAIHGLPPSSGPSRAPLTPEAKLGERLTLADGGLNCRQCHALGSQVIPMENPAHGVGLALIRQRLRPAFYRRWMIDPLRIDPTTKMPRFSVDGRTTQVSQILDGDAQAQFDAIWQYLMTLE